VEYVSTGERLAAFCVSDREFSVVRLAASPRTLERRVTAFLDGAAGEAAGEAAVARELYRALVEPVASRVRELGRSQTPQVIVVPWGPLHRLPFEALLDGDRYLVEKWELSYLPSATILKYLPRPAGKEAAPKRLVALVDPDTDYDGDGNQDYPALPFARVEVASIAPFFEHAVILAEKRALEEACARYGPTGDVVHLACHGEFFPHRPMDSTLYLGRGGASDGRLRAVEIFGMDLRRSRLVTLSGCETGKLNVAPGDDPVGIGTAFLHSGARALLVSLWKVEDEATAALMAAFYKRWLSSEDGNRARALREAKLHLLREGRFVRPAQWAAFVLIGLR
jgi:CHAT domain-containing protein